VLSWSPVQGVVSTVYKIQNFKIISEWEQVSEPNPSRYNKNNDNSNANIIRNVCWHSDYQVSALGLTNVLPVPQFTMRILAGISASVMTRSWRQLYVMWTSRFVYSRLWRWMAKICFPHGPPLHHPGIEARAPTRQELWVWLRACLNVVLRIKILLQPRANPWSSMALV
jgi:hypothetical protein